MRGTAGRAILTSILAVCSVAAWLMLAPRPLGGPLTYVVTDGVSMLPRLEAGDLVLVREASSYKVGDVAAYHSKSLGSVVLHRIIKTEDGRYLFQGDNNDFIDEDKPSEEAILGKEWVVIPGAGRFLSWIGRPQVAAIFAGAIGFILLAGINLRRRSSIDIGAMKPVPSPLRRPDHTAHAAYIATALVIAVALAVLVWTRPTTTAAPARRSVNIEGRFSYEAEAERTPVYPDGDLETGEAIFLELVDRLDVSFELAPPTAFDIADVRSEVSVLIKDANGWSREVPAQTSSSDMRLTTGIDLRALRRLMNRVQTITQVPQVSFTVEVRPEVVIEGTATNHAVKARVAPVLAFEADAFKMKLRPGETTPDGSTVDPLRPSVTQMVSVAAEQTKDIEIAGRRVPAATARVVTASAVLGLLIAFVWTLLARRNSDTQIDEAREIGARYADWIVETAAREPGPARTAIRVATFEDLVRVADRYDRLILHDELDGIHSYVVEESGTAYWYQVLSPTARRLTAVPSVNRSGADSGDRSASG